MIALEKNNQIIVFTETFEPGIIVVSAVFENEYFTNEKMPRYRAEKLIRELQADGWQPCVADHGTVAATIANIQADAALETAKNEFAWGEFGRIQKAIGRFMQNVDDADDAERTEIYAAATMANSRSIWWRDHNWMPIEQAQR